MSPLVPLPANSGFDYLNAYVFVRHDPATPECSINELFLCVEVAGIPGDTDGDGVINNPTTGCGAPILPYDDGDGTANSFPLALTEAYRFQIDRDCDGETDLGFRLAGPSPAEVKIEFDNFNPARTLNVVAGDFAFDPATNAANCPSSPITGRALIRINNWANYFTDAESPAGKHISPSLFQWLVDNENGSDGLPEEMIRGAVDVHASKLTLTETPDLILCPGDKGYFTLTVPNDGNTRVNNVVITDVLPDSVTFCGVISGSGDPTVVGNTLTFPRIDHLDPCDRATIVFCAQAEGQYVGTVTNIATAAGEFLSDCLLGSGGKEGVASNEASATITCKTPTTPTTLGRIRATYR